MQGEKRRKRERGEWMGEKVRMKGGVRKYRLRGGVRKSRLRGWVRSPESRAG